MNQDLKPHVGLRLRSFRERQGWSLRALAERCGLSINAISRIERGENSPTIASLNKLSTALSVPITDFFVERHHRSAIYIRNGYGERISNDGLSVQRLGRGLPGQQLEPYLLTIQPVSDSPPKDVTHPGEEFVYCLNGEILVCINGQDFPLRAGDSLLFQAMQPHHWRGLNGKEATILLIFQTAQDHSLARQRHRIP